MNPAGRQLRKQSEPHGIQEHGFLLIRIFGNLFGTIRVRPVNKLNGIADNELVFMTGITDYDAGAEKLLEKHPQIRLLNVTAGEHGSYSYYGDIRCHVPVMKTDRVLEKTGAGDTFCACALNYILEHGLDNLAENDLKEMLTFANAAASLIIQRKGALKVMPEKEQIENLLV